MLLLMAMKLVIAAFPEGGTVHGHIIAQAQYMGRFERK